MINTMGRKESFTKITNEDVFEPRDYLLFALLTGFTLAAIGTLLWHWFFHTAGFEQPLFFLTLTVMLAVVLVNNLGKWFFLLLMKRPSPRPAGAGWKVGVATTFV